MNRTFVPLLKLVAGMVCAAAVGNASGQAFPAKPIRIVVPYAAGGPSDMVARTVAQRMSQIMGNPVVVENRPGANGIIGMEHVAKSPGDGYTMVMFSLGGSVLNTVLREKLPYTLLKDFRPVGNMVNMAELLVVHPSVPAKSIKELVALAKARPNALNYGSSGIAGTPHLMGEMLKQAAGIEMTHVPYKGTGPATMDVISGQIQLIFTEVPVLLQHVKEGKLRALAVGTQQRSALLPDAPTMAESGFPQLLAYNWFGLQAPAATPKEIIGKLNAALVKALEHPDTKALLQSQGADPAPVTPEQFGQWVEGEVVKWARVVKTSGVKVQ